MQPFRIAVKDKAVKFIKKQDQATQRRLREKIQTIAQDPFDVQHSYWLAGANGVRSARVGGLRILFEVDKESHLLTILCIDSRGQVYKRNL